MTFLESNRLVLSPVEKTDYEKIASWLNDGNVTAHMFSGQRPMTMEQVEKMLDADINSEKNCVFMVSEKESGKAIGYAGLYEIHFTARKAEVRILIGEKSFWGKGYGTETIEMLSFYGFDRLNLQRLFLGYTSENKAAEGAYTNAGFKKEGVLVNDIYRNSKYYDTVRMAILREEYYKDLYEKHKKAFGPSF